MALLSVLPLAEAAAFTLGCILLDSRRFDAERVGSALAAVAVILIILLIVALTPVSTPEAVGLDPDGVHALSE